MRRRPAGPTRALALALALSCAPLPRTQTASPAEPFAAVLEMRSDSLGPQRASLSLRLRVSNPGPELSLQALEYRLHAEGEGFAVGRTRLDRTVPSGGEGDLSVRLELAYLELPPRAREQQRRGAAVTLSVRGRLLGFADLVPVAIEFDGETEAPGPGGP